MAALDARVRAIDHLSQLAALAGAGSGSVGGGGGTAIPTAGARRNLNSSDPLPRARKVGQCRLTPGLRS